MKFIKKTDIIKHYHKMEQVKNDAILQKFSDKNGGYNLHVFFCMTVFQAPLYWQNWVSKPKQTNLVKVTIIRILKHFPKEILIGMASDSAMIWGDMNICVAYTRSMWMLLNKNEMHPIWKSWVNKPTITRNLQLSR